MKNSLSHWMSVAPETEATVEEIGHFNARGMRRVFGCGVHCGRHYNFQMDIWITRDKRLMMRCWPPCKGIDWRSFEIKGIDVSKIPKPDKEKGLQDSWVPEAARNEFDEWLEDELVN